MRHFWVGLGALLSIAAATKAAALSVTDRAVTLPRIFADQPVPRWDYGHAVSFDLDTPVVYAFDAAGREVIRCPIAPRMLRGRLLWLTAFLHLASLSLPRLSWIRRALLRQ